MCSLSLSPGVCFVSLPRFIALCAAVASHTGLEEFSVENPRLFSKNEETAAHICRVVQNNTRLRSLYIGKHALSDWAASELSQALVRNLSLRVLDLRWCVCVCLCAPVYLSACAPGRMRSLRVGC
jgi:hypothetical protein